MFDEKDKPIPKHPDRVDLDDKDEVLYWTKRFHCSRGQLVMAMVKVGDNSSAVEAELKRRT
jgi:hypothetical protein